MRVVRDWAKLVRAGFPGFGMSCNNWSRPLNAGMKKIISRAVRDEAGFLCDATVESSAT
jgi:hypothetical protein